MTSTTITIAQLIATLKDHGCYPDEEFTAAAGQDYGYVASWALPDGNYAIQYGDNGRTDYAITDDGSDLACWLESPDLGGADTIIQTANIRGAGEVDEADENAEGPFYILATRDWYGPSETSMLVLDDRNDTRFPREFATYQEAADWIDEAESGTYRLSHNESGAPSYKIITE